MSGIINTVSLIGLLVLNLVIVFGILFALGKIALGHRDGWAHLIGVGIVILVVGLWESGQLWTAVRELITSPPKGPTAPGPMA